jgi:ribosomal protein S18 acetylase RimI-like enzyme
MSGSRSDLLSSVVFPRWEACDRSQTSHQFLIQVAQLQDLESLADVLTNSFHSIDAWYGFLLPLLRMGIQEDLRGRLRNPATHQICLFALASRPFGAEIPPSLNSLQQGRSSGELVGTVEISERVCPLWHNRQEPYLYLSNLAVNASYRRMGVAHQLLIASEQVASRWRFRELYLHVMEDNHAARRLYQNAGYRMQQAEWSLGSVLLGQPRQLLLKKTL